MQATTASVIGKYFSDFPELVPRILSDPDRRQTALDLISEGVPASEIISVLALERAPAPAPVYVLPPTYVYAPAPAPTYVPYPAPAYAYPAPPAYVPPRPVEDPSDAMVEMLLAETKISDKLPGKKIAELRSAQPRGMCAISAMTVFVLRWINPRLIDPILLYKEMSDNMPRIADLHETVVPDEGGIEIETLIAKMRGYVDARYRQPPFTGEDRFFIFEVAGMTFGAWMNAGRVYFYDSHKRDQYCCTIAEFNAHIASAREGIRVFELHPGTKFRELKRDDTFSFKKLQNLLK